MCHWHTLIAIICISQLLLSDAVPIKTGIENIKNSTSIPVTYHEPSKLENLSKDARINLIKENEDKIISVVRLMMEHDKSKKGDRLKNNVKKGDKGKATAHMDYEIDMGAAEDEKVEKIKDMFGKINEYLVCTYEDKSDCDSKFIDTKNDTKVKKSFSDMPKNNNHSKIRPKFIKTTHGNPKSLKDEPLTGAIQNLPRKTHVQPIGMFPPMPPNGMLMRSISGPGFRNSFPRQNHLGLLPPPQWPDRRMHPFSYPMKPAQVQFQRWPTQPRNMRYQPNGFRTPKFRTFHKKHLHIPINQQFANIERPINEAAHLWTGERDIANEKLNSDQKMEKSMLTVPRIERKSADKINSILSRSDDSSAIPRWPLEDRSIFQREDDHDGEVNVRYLHKNMDNFEVDDDFESRKEDFDANQKSGLFRDFKYASEHNSKDADQTFALPFDRMNIDTDNKFTLGPKSAISIPEADDQWKWSNRRRPSKRSEKGPTRSAISMMDFEEDNSEIPETRHWDRDVTPPKKDSWESQHTELFPENDDLFVKASQKIRTIDDAWEALEMETLGSDKFSSRKHDMKESLLSRPLEWPSHWRRDD